MTARDDAIEAAARAEYEWLLSGNTYMVPWADLLEDNREHYRKRPTRSYGAMAPIIERAALIAAGQKLRDWADEKYPEPFGPTGTRRRAILASARRIEPEPTADEISAALAGLIGGMARRPEIGGAS